MRVAVVGDTPADLAMGRSAGAGRVIGVLTGVGGRAELEPLADVVLGVDRGAAGGLTLDRARTRAGPRRRYVWAIAPSPTTRVPSN